MIVHEGLTLSLIVSRYISYLLFPGWPLFNVSGWCQDIMLIVQGPQGCEAVLCSTNYSDFTEYCCPFQPLFERRVCCGAIL